VPSGAWAAFANWIDNVGDTDSKLKTGIRVLFIFLSVSAMQLILGVSGAYPE
jgi:hypothetical protein